MGSLNMSTPHVPYWDHRSDGSQYFLVPTNPCARLDDTILSQMAAYNLASSQPHNVTQWPMVSQMSQPVLWPSMFVSQCQQASHFREILPSASIDTQLSRDLDQQLASKQSRTSRQRITDEDRHRIRSEAEQNPHKKQTEIAGRQNVFFRGCRSLLLAAQFNVERRSVLSSSKETATNPHSTVSKILRPKRKPQPSSLPETGGPSSQPNDKVDDHGEVSTKRTQKQSKRRLSTRTAASDDLDLTATLEQPSDPNMSEDDNVKALLAISQVLKENPAKADPDDYIAIGRLLERLRYLRRLPLPTLCSDSE